MNRRFAALVSAVIVAVAVGVGAAKTSKAASFPPPKWVLHGPYSPTIDPANFVTAIDNEYFPLKPGTAFHYKGYSGETSQTDDWW